MKRLKAILTHPDTWYPFHVLSHPMDGFYEIRHRERGHMSIALLLVFLFGACYSMNRSLASFIVNEVDPRDVDSLQEIFGIFIFYFLFCVSNWSITCLMGGEGRMKDICICVGYSLLPMILTIIPAIILSQFLAANEESFYSIIIGLGIAYSAVLVLTGIMNIHNFTLAKTLVTLVLTFVAMLIIIFVVVMMADLIGQVYSFFYSIYMELLFRH